MIVNKFYLEWPDNTLQTHYRTFRLDRCTLGYDLWLCTLRFARKLQCTGRNTYYERTPCLMDNPDFVHIQVDTRCKDHRYTRADKCKRRRDISRWLRTEMDYKDLVVQVQLQILLFILNVNISAFKGLTIQNIIFSCFVII